MRGGERADSSRARDGQRQRGNGSERVRVGVGAGAQRGSHGSPGSASSRKPHAPPPRKKSGPPIRSTAAARGHGRAGSIGSSSAKLHATNKDLRALRESLEEMTSAAASTRGAICELKEQVAQGRSSPERRLKEIDSESEHHQEEEREMMRLRNELAQVHQYYIPGGSLLDDSFSFTRIRDADP